jgi:hypothetical protein
VGYSEEVADSKSVELFGGGIRKQCCILAFVYVTILCRSPSVKESPKPMKRKVGSDALSLLPKRHTMSRRALGRPVLRTVRRVVRWSAARRRFVLISHQ